MDRSERISKSQENEISSLISSILGDLGSLLGDTCKYRAKNTIDKVDRSVSNIQNLVDTPKEMNFSERGAAASRTMHTWLRKGEDCILTSALYNRINNSNGYYAWYIFSENVARIVEQSEQYEVDIYYILKKAIEAMIDIIRSEDIYKEDILTTQALIDCWAERYRTSDKCELKDMLFQNKEFLNSKKEKV